MSSDSPVYEEELFGILTEDELYIDCLMVKPAGCADADLQGLTVWVPKHPLTKSSVITCARREVEAFGAQTRMAHLVFDLRGTGDSDGDLRSDHYDRDLQGIRLWAAERFGSIKLLFFGTPTTEAQVNMMPLRPGVVMEAYLYRATGVNAPTVLYLSRYGHFSEVDEATCIELANAGFNVYGLDPYRYLLHASHRELLSLEDLRQDLSLACDLVGGEAYMIGRRVAAGLALLWATEQPRILGVIASRRAQAGLLPPHIFANPRSSSLNLRNIVGQIAPRPVGLITPPSENGGMLEKTKSEMAALYLRLGEPRRLEEVADVTPEILLELLHWLEEKK